MMKRDNTVIPDGQKIREKRLAKGLTQEKLAFEIRVAKSTIERLEKNEPTYISTLVLVAQRLEESVKDLILSQANPIEIGEALVFSKQISKSQSTETWQNLYCKHAVDQRHVMSSQWLEITSLEVCSASQESLDDLPTPLDMYTQKNPLRFKGPPLRFSEIIGRHKNVLLTGPAGSGKTTTFRLMTTSWVCQGETSDKQSLSFHLQLKEAEPFIEARKNEGMRIDMPMLVGWVVTSILEKKCSKEELQGCKSIQDLFDSSSLKGQNKAFTCNEILKYLQEEVAKWFREEGCHQSNVIVLVDGINELSPYLRDILKHKTEDLARKQCRIVVSCRSNFANALFSGAFKQFARFELQELDNQQVRDHLERKLPGHGGRIFDSQIIVDPKLLSITKNPFYLFLIVQRIKRNPTSKIPATRANLIDDFITDAIERKRGEGVYPPSNLKDDMIYIVLEKVAKWSIDMLTLRDTGTLRRFPSSQEFQEIQSPAFTFKSLEIAENYGLLQFSGLIEESRERQGYPLFFHDTFRDFFAAKYLSSLDLSELLRRLPEIVEYFAWDEPLMFYLEFCTSKDVCTKITEFSLSKDALLGGMCARHANILEKELCMESALRVSKLPHPFVQDQLLREIVQQDKIACNRSFPSYALERLTVSELISLVGAKLHNPELKTHILLALSKNATLADLELLKSTWVRLPKDLSAEVACVLSAIASIPTYEAFEFFVDGYKHIHSLPSFELKGFEDIGKLLFCSAMCTFIGYSPSLQQAVDAFSPQDAPDELGVLLSMISRVKPAELQLLGDLVFHENSLVASRASELLVKSLGAEGLPTLMKRLIQIENKIAKSTLTTYGYLDFQLRSSLLRMIVQLAPEEASKALVERIKKIKDKYPISSYDNESYRCFLLELLSETRSPEALNVIIKEACLGFRPKTAIFCVELLEPIPKPQLLAFSVP